MAKIEHLRSDFYFSFLRALPNLGTDSVVEPVFFFDEQCISIFEIERELTLREEFRRERQSFDKLSDIMLGYGLLQVSFVCHRRKRRSSDQFFRTPRKAFEEAVLSGAQSADKILMKEAEHLSCQANDLLASCRFRELPETIVHTDLHDGNIFYQNDRWRIGDWSELLIGPIGADIVLFFHAVGLAHPSKRIPELLTPAFFNYMSGLGELLTREQLLFSLEAGYRLLPAIQLNSLQRSMPTTRAKITETTPEQLFWAKALLTAFDDEQTRDNQFLNKIYTEVNRYFGIN